MPKHKDFYSLTATDLRIMEMLANGGPLTGMRIVISIFRQERHRHSGRGVYYRIQKLMRMGLVYRHPITRLLELAPEGKARWSEVQVLLEGLGWPEWWESFRGTVLDLYLMAGQQPVRGGRVWQRRYLQRRNGNGSL